MVNEFEIKKQICDIGRRIYNRNMVAANDGNISVKLNDNEFLCTPTGVSKGFMTPEFICKVDAQGNVIQANPGFKPSSEIKMHMRVYQKRPDVGSVVHAHPIYATSFAIAGIPLARTKTVLTVITAAVPATMKITNSSQDISMISLVVTVQKKQLRQLETLMQNWLQTSQNRLWHSLA